MMSNTRQNEVIRGFYMYGRGAGAGLVAVGAAAVLPNTGSNLIVTVAVSAAAGLVAWGTLYVLANK
jgi:hypothetical protein